MADRIAYDARAYFTRQRGDNSPLGVLKSRKAICDGYANLFEALCQHAKVEAVKIPGFAKGAGYVPGTRGRGEPHAWNAVKLDGKWQLLDATWGAGFVKNQAFVKEFNPFFFEPQPEQMIFSHLPKEPRWQLLAEPISAEVFEAQPKADWRLFDMGFKVADLRRAMQAIGFREFVIPFRAPGRFKVEQAPPERTLRAGKLYTFRFVSADYASMALQNNAMYAYCEQRGNVFEVTVRPLAGTLRVGGSIAPQGPGRSYSYLLEYLVQAGAGAE